MLYVESLDADASSRYIFPARFSGRYGATTLQGFMDKSWELPGGWPGLLRLSRFGAVVEQEVAVTLASSPPRRYVASVAREVQRTK